MLKHPLPRIDKDETLRQMLLPFCRFKEGDIWEDKHSGHKIACIDAADKNELKKLFERKKAALAIHDPPYNLIAFNKMELENFIRWCKLWIDNTYDLLKDDAALYIWLGADQTAHYQPLPQFMLMMEETKFKSRSFITMRNQRGYGTQKNWMAVRQELLFYTKGNPYFNVKAEYTDIPKILKGYYKVVNGEKTENLERSKAATIRAGNVWVDIQQIFYRMEENVNGCYAQKPIKAIERIINASSKKRDLVIDFFSHSGTTLLAAEITGRKCFTADIDPVYCEITLRRLERYRKFSLTGWQNSNPFAEEITGSEKLRAYLERKYGIRYRL